MWAMKISKNKITKAEIWKEELLNDVHKGFIINM